MTEAAQLKIDGGETPVIAPARRYRLSTAQKAILRRLAEDGSIRSTDAGVIVHEHRRGATAQSLELDRKYAAADGLEAMKRLERQGLCRRDYERLGRWLQP